MPGQANRVTKKTNPESIDRQRVGSSLSCRIVIKRIPDYRFNAVVFWAADYSVNLSGVFASREFQIEPSMKKPHDWGNAFPFQEIFIIPTRKKSNVCFAWLGVWGGGWCVGLQFFNASIL